MFGKFGFFKFFLLDFKFVFLVKVLDDRVFSLRVFWVICFFVLNIKVKDCNFF